MFVTGHLSINNVGVSTLLALGFIMFRRTGTSNTPALSIEHLQLVSIRLCEPTNYLGLVKVQLKSHSFFAKSASFALALGLPMLLSKKYSPLTPLTCGFNAT